jgi:acid phosphatase type 7
MLRPSRALALFVVLLGALGAHAANLVRTPYLQSVTADQAIVAFSLDAKCAAKVRYGVGEALASEVPAPVASGTYAAPLTGLLPATEYTYEVDACGARARGLFRTAPGPTATSVRFGAFADMGTGTQGPIAAALHARRPDLVLAAGDVAYSVGSKEEFDKRYFAPMRELLASVPVFPTLGNHEYGTDRGQPYLDAFVLPTNNDAGTERFYSFDWGPVHFATIDSSCAVGFDTTACSLRSQRDWLAEDLAASNAPWKVVFMHHPPYSSGKHGSQLTLRREFGPLFEQHGVDLVLTGHDHNYERSRPMKAGQVVAEGTPGAVTYVVVGNGGASLRAFPGSQPEWSVVRNDTDKGFLDVEVSGGTLTARALTATGAELDSFTLRKDVPLQPEPTPEQPGTGPVTEPGPAPSQPGEPGQPPTGPGQVEPDPSEPPGGGCAQGSGAATALPLAFGMVLLMRAALRRRRARASAKGRRG